MIKCPNCSSPLRLDPGTGKLCCDYCDSVFDPERFRDSDKTVEADEYKEPKAAQTEAENETEEESSRDTFESVVFTCPQCGGEIFSTEETAATFCSYCGSSVILQSRIKRQKKPDYVIPFSRTKEQAEEAYRRLLKRSLFAPRKMLTEDKVEKFRGIYMPYWVYNLSLKDSVKAPAEKSHREGNYTVTEHYELSTEVTARYKGLSFDAASGFSDNLSGAIAPFDIGEGKAFTPSYLSGFYADAGDVEDRVYVREARRLAKNHGAGLLAEDAVFRKYHINEKTLGDQLNFANEPSQMGYFPVWFLSVRNKKENRVSYAVVNGQTGVAAADIPIDFKRYLAGSLLIAAVLFVLFELFFTIKPTTLMWLALFFNVVSLIVCNKQLNQIYIRDKRLDDAGYQSTCRDEQMAQYREQLEKARKRKEKQRSQLGDFLHSLGGCLTKGLGILFWIILFSGLANYLEEFGLLIGIVLLLGISGIKNLIQKKKSGVRLPSDAAKAPAPLLYKLPTLLLPISGIALFLGVRMYNPVADAPYYMAATCMMGLAVVSFFLIVKEHNLLTTRKLPQFNRRGGDEV